MSRKRNRGHKLDEPFVAIYKSALSATHALGLSAYACKLLLDLMSQFQGDNNGDLSCAWSYMSKRGWRSRTTLWRAQKELLEKGFIFMTRMGHMPSTCSLFAITWFPLDVSPKFDPEAVHSFRAKRYANLIHQQGIATQKSGLKNTSLNPVLEQ